MYISLCASAMFMVSSAFEENTHFVLGDTYGFINGFNNDIRKKTHFSYFGLNSNLKNLSLMLDLFSLLLLHAEKRCRNKIFRKLPMSPDLQSFFMKFICCKVVLFIYRVVVVGWSLTSFSTISHPYRTFIYGSRRDG